MVFYKNIHIWGNTKKCNGYVTLIIDFWRQPIDYRGLMELQNLGGLKNRYQGASKLLEIVCKSKCMC